MSRCSKEILHATGIVLSKARHEVRFVVLPVFMAGVFATADSDKELALKMIAAVEPHSFGGSVERVSNLLLAVIRKQGASIVERGISTSVDWVEEMNLSGQRLIITGL